MKFHENSYAGRRYSVGLDGRTNTTRLASAYDVLLTVHLSIFISVINLLAPELFFLILAHPVYKMWIKQGPNTLELWNKLHFEEKRRRVYTVFKIFSTYICWINI